MIFFQISASLGQNLCYLIGDEETKEAVVIDPSGEVEKILKLATENDLKIKYIIDTHSHADHTAGNGELASKTGAKILLHKKARIKKDIDLSDGDVITFGNKKMRVIYTPGHSPDSICLQLENKLFTGDTLFVGECGRTDIPGGSSEDLYDSLFKKIRKLNDELEIYPGHDYGSQKHSILGYEKRNNYTLEPRTKEEFIKFMMED
jgi:glyoxylase-like metal-dependent hydrolase (beta-lactamase superfamily II)